MFEIVGLVINGEVMLGISLTFALSHQRRRTQTYGNLVLMTNA